MAKKIFLLSGKFILIFLIGALGGIWGEHYLLPRIISYSPLNKIKWLNSSRFGSTTIINQTKKEFITQDQAIEEIVNNISPSIVGVRTFIKSKNKSTILTEGSGIVFTNDGTILTTNNLFPANQKQFQIEVFINQKWRPAKVVSTNIGSGLALVKVNNNNLLSITDWSEHPNLAIGQKCILAGFNPKNQKEMINLGFIKTYPPAELSFSNEPGFMTGGTVFDLSGKVIGLISVQTDQSIKFIPTNDLLKLINHQNEER